MSESGLCCLDVDSFGDHRGGVGSAEVVVTDWHPSGISRLTGEGEFALLYGRGGVFQCRWDVLGLEIGKVREDLAFTSAGR